MYIMCVCLFSTLSRWVGALQISIIIIIGMHCNHCCCAIVDTNPVAYMQYEHNCHD